MAPRHRAKQPATWKRGVLGLSVSAALVVTSLGGAAFAATAGGSQSGGVEPVVAATSLDPSVEDQVVADGVTPEGEESQVTEEEAASVGEQSTEAEVPQTDEGEAPAEETGEDIDHQTESTEESESAQASEGDEAEIAEEGGPAEPPASSGVYRAASRALADLPNPIPVFQENFNAPGVRTLTGIQGTRFTGTGGMTYSAPDYWGYPARCNGMVISYNSTGPLAGMPSFNGYGTCDGPTNWWSWSTLRAQAQLLGTLRNQQGENINVNNNYALTELSSGWWNNNTNDQIGDGYISSNTGGGPNQKDANYPGKVQFKMDRTATININSSAYPESAQGYRYLAAGVNVATTACPMTGENFVAPLLGFHLFDNSNRLFPLFSSSTYINTCEDERGSLAKTTITRPAAGGNTTTRPLDATYGRLNSKEAIGWYGATAAGQLPNVGLQLTNFQQFTGGNDSSLDKIAIEDVTPLLYKSFADSRVKYGETTDLTFKIQSRSDLSYKGATSATGATGWEFTDALPVANGIQLTAQGTPRFAAFDADGNAVAGGCSATVSTGSSVTVKNGVMEANVAECRITVQVTAQTDEDCPDEILFENYEPQFKDADGNWTMKYVDFVEGDEVTFYGTGEISWEKLDSFTGDLLPGATFTLTGPSYPSGLDVTSTDGHYKVDGLKYGTYTITEKTPPTGYEGVTEPQTVTIAAGACTATLEFTNDRLPGSVAWKKVDYLGDALAGSSWTLTGPSYPDGVLVEDCVGDTADDCAGLDKNPNAGEFLVPDLDWGDYTMVETKAPEGYAPITDTFTFPEITATNRDVALAVAIPNDKLGSVAWEKVDQDGAPLAGSVWTLRGPSYPDGVLVEDCVAASADDCGGPDKNPNAGEFLIPDLTLGHYTLVETKAPAGYVLGDFDEEFTITNENPDYAFEVAFKNEQKTPPTLPLTGGQSAAMFTILGLVALGGAGGGAVFVARRRSANRA